MTKKKKNTFDVDEQEGECKKMKELEEENKRLKDELEKTTRESITGELKEENDRLKELNDKLQTELSIRSEPEPETEFAEIKSKDNFIRVKKNQDDIRWLMSILNGMLSSYYKNSKKTWR